MNGPYIPMSVVNGVFVVKSFDELSKVENKRLQNDFVAKKYNHFCLESC